MEVNQSFPDIPLDRTHLGRGRTKKAMLIAWSEREHPFHSSKCMHSRHRNDRQSCLARHDSRVATLIKKPSCNTHDIRPTSGLVYQAQSGRGVMV